MVQTHQRKHIWHSSLDKVGINKQKVVTCVCSLQIDLYFFFFFGMITGHKMIEGFKIWNTEHRPLSVLTNHNPPNITKFVDKQDYLHTHWFLHKLLTIFHSEPGNCFIFWLTEILIKTNQDTMYIQCNN